MTLMRACLQAKWQSTKKCWMLSGAYGLWVACVCHMEVRIQSTEIRIWNTLLLTNKTNAKSAKVSLMRWWMSGWMGNWVRNWRTKVAWIKLVGVCTSAFTLVVVYYIYSDIICKFFYITLNICMKGFKINCFKILQ